MAWLELFGGENEVNREMKGTYSRLGAFRIIKECLEPHSTMTVEQTAQALHELLPAPDDRAFPGGGDLFGNLILELSQQIDYDNAAQDRLVQVLQRLQDSDRVKKHIRAGAAGQGYGRYESMPQMMFSLEYYAASRLDKDKNEEYFLNLRAFIARLCRAGVMQGQAWLVEEMRIALEDSLPGGNIDIASIMGAAIIILFAGEWLYNEVVRAPKCHEIDHNDLWETGTYYNGPRHGLARWKHWQRQLVRVDQIVRLDQESRRLILRAAWYMQGMAQCLVLY
ncbi:hypothetical protein ASPBRDRAFT_197551 [Aspergillus brasiliensis CBS 101740]|uniref:Uncharacterized protein n=1 Tax=Aspergillus brasiliensis (strain CBS 101740 / IMI 381727 / IBT 21946) TaxID=767769 RepID=A0A1L9UDU2_ASPBC|nr:hypothetical protein ASPBRDRAFT_197551 [Aspergillus brasiliensis CBS 101740]